MRGCLDVWMDVYMYVSMYVSTYLYVSMYVFMYVYMFASQGVGGADANGVDMHLLSPLHLTGLYNRPDIARVLLMCGASPRLAGGIARTALARRGKLWSPLEMAEEACTEGGELDEGVWE